jgi:alkylation response protein AidB-like acyl-CoA dehydrogenase
VPEVDGGMGYSAVELAIVLDELGRVADPSPFLATTSQYAPLVREAFGSSSLLRDVCGGSTGAVAWDGSVTAASDGTLTGVAHHVVDGDRADRLAVVADGGVFVVDSGAVTVTREPCIDGSFHVATVTFDATPVLHAAPDAGDAAVRALDEALVGISAATVGASQRIFEIALGHLKDRKQFDVPIGSFQALKHMAVDVYIAIERARALCQFAGLLIAEDDARRRTVASMAKSAAGDAQRIAVQHGIQFFGGLGYTWENDLQLYVRRAKVGELLLGSSASHRAAVARTALTGVAS